LHLVDEPLAAIAVPLAVPGLHLHDLTALARDRHLGLAAQLVVATAAGALRPGAADYRRVRSRRAGASKRAGGRAPQTGVALGIQVVSFAAGAQGTGADIMKRIAAPMVGDMVPSTVLTLVAIPAIYSLWREREVSRRETVDHPSD
jgi:hypothetical protein